MSVRALSPPAFVPPTLDHLLKVPGKAELIGGRIVNSMATGYPTSQVVGRFFRKLVDHADATGKGEAFADNTGIAILALPSGRQSFSPDAAFYTGSLPANRMRFINGAPDFAVEVPSEDDYGPSAEADMAAQRADYFAAGTLVVWHVDPVARVIDCYRSSSRVQPEGFGQGQAADAQPAVPGWRIAVDWTMA